MSVLEDWCNEKGLTGQQKVELKKHMKKDGGDPVRDKKLFDFLSDKKDAKELAKNKYVYISAHLDQSQTGAQNKPIDPNNPIFQERHIIKEK